MVERCTLRSPHQWRGWFRFRCRDPATLQAFARLHRQCDGEGLKRYRIPAAEPKPATPSMRRPQGTSLNLSGESQAEAPSLKFDAPLPGIQAKAVRRNRTPLRPHARTPAPGNISRTFAIHILLNDEEVSQAHRTRPSPARTPSSHSLHVLLHRAWRRTSIMLQMHAVRSAAP